MLLFLKQGIIAVLLILIEIQYPCEQEYQAKNPALPHAHARKQLRQIFLSQLLIAFLKFLYTFSNFLFSFFQRQSMSKKNFFFKLELCAINEREGKQGTDKMMKKMKINLHMERG